MQAVWDEVASLVAFVRPLAVVKKRWTQERLLLAISEYARFLLLKCRMEDGDGKVIAVPDDIAWVWKRHVLRDSAEYTRFNDKVGGHLGFVEFPPGPSGDRKGATWHLYRMAFDESPPLCIWQDAGPAAANAGRTTRHVGAAAVQTTPSPLMRGVAQAGPVRCASRTVLPGIFFELEGFSPDQNDQATAPLRAAGGPVIPPPRRRMPATRTLHPSRPRPHHRTQRTVPAPTANATGGSAPMVRPPNIPPAHPTLLSLSRMPLDLNSSRGDIRRDRSARG